MIEHLPNTYNAVGPIFSTVKYVMLDLVAHTFNSNTPETEAKTSPIYIQGYIVRSYPRKQINKKEW